MPSRADATAVLFPGQASQTPGMRDAVAALRPDLLQAAAEAVGDDPFAQANDGTEFAQPAIHCASVTAWSGFEETPRVLAGHSLGEFAALVAAGALTERDGLRLVALRGRLMAQAAAGSDADGGMLALLGVQAGEAGEIARGHGVTVANDNAPGQIVLSGPREGLDAAARDAAGRERKAVPLRVAGAFHSPAMAPAVPEFRAALEEVEFSEPHAPVYSSQTAEPFGDDVRDRLAQALVRPVRWRETLLRLREREGVSSFVETGPGKVLTNLVRRTLDGVQARALDPMDGRDA